MKFNWSIGLLVLVVICFGFLIAVNVLNNGNRVSSKDAVPNNNKAQYDHMMKIIRIQNDTIATLEAILMERERNVSFKLAGVPKTEHLIQKVDTPLVSNLQFASISSSKDHTTSSFIASPTPFETECENRYGLELVELWKKNKELWCESADQVASITCYPYHQVHKKKDGRGSDVVCEARNIVIDFSKVRGSHGSSKPSLGRQYLDFDRGSIYSSCRRTSKYRQNLFMPHHAIQMASFQGEVSISKEELEQLEKEPKTTYLLARDEDCENSFHSTADFMNMYLVYSMLELDISHTQVVLFDKHTDGPYTELIQRAYSPKNNLLRHQHYNGKKILFEHLVWHLESPAGLIFPKVSRPDPLRCYSTGLFQAYRRYILQSFDLLNVPPPPIPTITLSLRNRTPQKNVGRVLANVDELVSVIKQGNLINYQVIDGGKMSFGEHLKIIRSTNILVGVHGAGLMMIMFAAEEAILIEMHPSYRQDRHFRHAARMTGKIYMPLRTSIRESCQGSSDNVKIPAEEFRKTLDGAVRIARNFDDGISECGLVCPYEFLALDDRLDRHYKGNERKHDKINTQFPCG